MDNEIDNFLDGLNKDAPADPFTPEVKDPFAKETAPKEEVKKEEGTEGEGGDIKPLPFHKDPKVQRYIQKEVEKLAKNVKPTEVQQFIEDTKDEADDILARIIGNDTPEKVSAAKDLKRYLLSLGDKAATKARAELQAEQEAAQAEEVQTQNALIQGFEDIEEAYGVDLTSSTPVSRKLRNDFVDFIRRVSPKDEYGEVSQFPDFEETFALFQEMGTKKTPNRAKELASRTMQRSSDAPAAPAVTDNSWKAVDKAFSKLVK